MNKLLLLYLGLLIIKCAIGQLTPITINHDIQINEISTKSNQYKTSTDSSITNICNFNLYFSIKDRVIGRDKEAYQIESNNSLASISKSLVFGYFVLNISLLASTIPTSINLNVSYLSVPEPSITNIKLLCEDINIQDIKINIISKTLLDQNSCQYIICEVKGLNYSLPYLTISSPPYSLAPVQLSKEQYMVYIGNCSNYIVGPIDVVILFYSSSFKFKIDSYYKLDWYTSGVSLKIYPYQEYVETEPALSPLILISSPRPFDQSFILINLDDQIFITPKKLSFFMDQTEYSYIASLPRSLSSNQTFKLLYNNGSSLISTPLPFTYTQYNYITIPTWPAYASNSLNIFTIKFETNSLISLNNKVIKHSYYTYSFISSFPFGYYSGNSSSFSYTVSYPKRLTTSLLEISEYPLGSVTSALIETTPITQEPKSTPSISFFEMIFIRGTKYLIRIKADDINGIEGILVGTNRPISYALETLMEGTNKNGTFEFIYDIRDTLSITIVNQNGYQSTFEEEDYLYNNQDGAPVFLKLSNPNININSFGFSDFKFIENNIKIINQNDHRNILLFNSSVIKKENSPMAFRIYDDISYDGVYGDSGIYPIQWDEKLQLFYCKFIVPSNIAVGNLHYSLIFSSKSQFHSGAFNQPLIIDSANFDSDGPMVTAITTYSDLESFGWRLTIKDINGLKFGIIKAIGLVDNSIYKVNINQSDLFTGTAYNGQFIVAINITFPCVLQNFRIIYIYLVDGIGNESIFSNYSPSKKGIAISNPLRGFIGNQEILTIPNVCNTSNIDFTPPLLKEFKISRNIVDTGSTDRKVLFSFRAIDNETGLLPYQHPVVYLLSRNLKLLECESTIISINDIEASYSCEIEIPIGWSGDVLVSVYGLINRGGHFQGIPTSTLQTIISTNMTFNPILTRYDKYLSTGDSDLVLYGRILKNTKLINISLSNGESFNVIPRRVIGESSIIVPINKYIDKPFTVKAIMNSNIESNSITINPISFNLTFSSNETSKCLGDPICGGKDHGYCDKDLGCICYSPWTDYDCLSKVIIVPQPSFNTSYPEVEMPTGNTDQSNAVYKLLISLYGIRELDINRKPVNTFKFEKWDYKELDSYTGIYKTNISVESNLKGTTNATVTATIKWYQNETTINFANNNLTMLPSSIKYTIQIDRYPFISKVNSLELIIFSSFESSKNKDICSSKQFTNSPDEKSDYLKIQIENKSFYGRFIKRAILDSNNIAILKNELLDSSFNIINAPNQVQSFIGISIPSFESSVFIDPDFSIILNSNFASSNLCTNNKIISNAKIAGIVIGCVVFVVALTVSISYHIIKKKKHSEFIKNANQKMKQMESNKL